VITPSTVIEEWDKLRRLLRQRPLLTALVTLVLVGFLAWTTGLVPADMWRDPAPREVRIQAPEDGATVGIEEDVRGVGATPGAFYYPVVTPRDTDAPFVAGNRLTVHADGSWEGLVRFGDTATPGGTRFRLQIVQSASSLSQDSLSHSSSGLRFSRSVEVTRR
jgi:hypothetical protein